MKILKFIIMGFLSLLLNQITNGQSNLIDITSKSEEGFNDFIFNITDKRIDENNNWVLTAKGQYENTIVGFKVIIKNEIAPGIINGKPDQSGMVRNAGQIISIGLESDNFIMIMSELYGYNSESPFTKSVFFDCFSLNSEIGILENGNFKFKLFFDPNNESNMYSEIFLDINLSSCLITLNEKDPGYRENIITVLTQ